MKNNAHSFPYRCFPEKPGALRPVRSLALFIVQISACTLSAQVMIDPALPPSPQEKPGYHLIFTDEFTTFDSTVWDRSGPGNDDYHYGEPMLCQSLNARNAPKNPSNVLPADSSGYLPLRVRVGEDQNACTHSSAEIKTFQNVYPSPHYRGWKVYPDSYVEVRMKAPFCPGVTAALWLYGPSHDNYCEIDFVEMYGNKPNAFQTNFHYGPHEHVLHDPEKVEVVDLSGNQVSLGAHFLNYAVAFDADKQVEIYVNDNLVSRKTQYRDKHGNFEPRKHVQPFDLRISTGSSTLSGGDVSDCDRLPVYLLVDYVRIYLKDGARAVRPFKPWQSNMHLCSDLPWGDGSGYGVTYYPGAVYTWSDHPNFDLYDYEQDSSSSGVDDWQFYWVTVHPGTPPGVYHQELSVRFPDGYMEVLPLDITVSSGTAAAPKPGAIVRQMALDETVSAAVRKQPGTTGYEWSVDNSDWQFVDNLEDSTEWNVCPSAFARGASAASKTICVRAKIPCNTSDPVCQTVEIPETGGSCPDCQPAPLVPESIRYTVVFNALGQMVRAPQDLQQPRDQIPEGLPSGLYIVQYFDAIGRLVRTRKVSIVAQN